MNDMTAATNATGMPTMREATGVVRGIYANDSRHTMLNATYAPMNKRTAIAIDDSSHFTL
jgi:hypothetical protein